MAVVITSQETTLNDATKDHIADQLHYQYDTIDEVQNGLMIFANMYYPNINDDTKNDIIERVRYLLTQPRPIYQGPERYDPRLHPPHQDPNRPRGGKSKRKNKRSRRKTFSFF